MMKRREFITLLGGAVVSWPFEVHGQRSERPRLIGAEGSYLAAAAIADVVVSELVVHRVDPSGGLEGQVVEVMGGACRPDRRVAL